VDRVALERKVRLKVWVTDTEAVPGRGALGEAPYARVKVPSRYVVTPSHKVRGTAPMGGMEASVTVTVCTSLHPNLPHVAVPGEGVAGRAVKYSMA